MDRLPTHLLVEISVHLASLPGGDDDSDSDNNDTQRSISILAAASDRSRILLPGCLARLNSFALTCRRCFAVCNPILHETAIAIDLVRFLNDKPWNPSIDTAAAVALGDSDSIANAQAVTIWPRLPPVESTELLLSLPLPPRLRLRHGLAVNGRQSSSSSATSSAKQLPPNRAGLAPATATPDFTSPWAHNGALVVSAAASGNIALLQRLVTHFPSPRRCRQLLPDRDLDFVTQCLTSPLGQQHASLLYLRYSYFLPLPCASHFHWRQSHFQDDADQCYQRLYQQQQHPQQQQHENKLPPLAAAVASPIHAAACHGQDATVSWLLRRGASVHDVAWNCCHCPSPHMRFLLEHALLRSPDYLGALPTSSSPSSGLYFNEVPAATPLSLALTYHRQSTARLLISHGAAWDRAIPPSYGVSPLHIMAAGAMTDLLQWIDATTSSTSPPRHHDWPDDQGLYALHYAAAAGSPGLDVAHNSITTTMTTTTTTDVVNLPRQTTLDLVRVLLRLGAVISPSRFGLRRLIQTELRRMRHEAAARRRPPSSAITTACTTADGGTLDGQDVQAIADTEGNPQRRDWARHMVSLLDEIDPDDLSECPVAFAKGVGNNDLAAALSGCLAAVDGHGR